jgi:hypothetical protein
MASETGEKPPKNKGGRPRGRQNDTTLKRIKTAKKGLAIAMETGVTPLEVILKRMRGEKIPVAQVNAAIAAAPYVHPKLSAVAFRDTTPPTDTIDLSQCTAAELALLRKLLSKSAPPADVPQIEGVVIDADEGEAS